MGRTRVHVSRENLARNKVEGTNLPVYKVAREGQNDYTLAHSVAIDGPSRFVYHKGQPIASGGEAWLETNAPVRELANGEKYMPPGPRNRGPFRVGNRPGVDYIPSPGRYWHPPEWHRRNPVWGGLSRLLLLESLLGSSDNNCCIQTCCNNCDNNCPGNG